MKRTIIAVILGMATFLCSAQNHLECMGVPMGSTLHSFTSSLEKKGYDFNASFSSSTCSILTGLYDGKKCSVIVNATNDRHLVSDVTIVILDRYTCWDEIQEGYSYMKKYLTSTYKISPKEESIVFDSPFRQGDGKEMDAIRIGKCHITCRYYVNNGNLNLTLSMGKIAVVFTDDAD